MRRSLAIASAFAALVLTSYVGSVGIAAAADGAPWSVRSVDGTAQVRAASGDWQALGNGRQIGVGHEIRTGEDGKVLLARDDETVTIGSGSAFEMQPASNGMMTKIYQKIGTLMFKVHKQPNRHFEVQTPYLVAAVKGTTFTVSVDGSGGAVHVIEGLVEVGNIGGPDKILVRPGTTASVAAKRGSKVQIGVTPKKSDGASKGKQSQGPRIDRDLGAASVDIERSSNGLFKSPRDPSAIQSASRDKSDGGNALGKDKGFGDTLGSGLAVGNGNGNGNSGGNGNGNGNSGGNGSGGGQGNGNAGGNGNGNGNGQGKGKGNS